MRKIANIHPGRILREEFLEPMGIGITVLSNEIDLPEAIIHRVIAGEQSLTADIARRLSGYFKVSKEFWIGLQDDFDRQKGNYEL